MGRRLRMLRREAGYTLDEVAKLAGIGGAAGRNGPSVGRMETRGPGHVGPLLRICEVLGKKLDRARREVLGCVAWNLPTLDQLMDPRTEREDEQKHQIEMIRENLQLMFDRLEAQRATARKRPAKGKRP